MTEQTATLDLIEAYVPARSVSIEQAAARLGLNRHQTRLFRRVHGLDTLRDDPGQGLTDLLLPAAQRVVRSAGRELIRYVIYAHTIQNVAPADVDVAAELAARLNLGRAEAFALTQQNCATGLAAVDIAAELLRADGDPEGRALVVTGEKAFSRLAQLIENTTIMGEASTACLVSVSDGTGTGDGLRVRSYVTRTDGQHAEIFRPSPTAQQAFLDTYTERLTAVIAAAAADAGLRRGDITLIVPYNVNHTTWRKVIAALGLDRDRVYLDNISRYAHCFCSDPFLNLATLRAEGRLTPGHYLLTAVGLGATYAAMVVEKE
jgi:3-oxoacyl-[acyl-carrier-protein] synthase III